MSEQITDEEATAKARLAKGLTEWRDVAECLVADVKAGRLPVVESVPYAVLISKALRSFGDDETEAKELINRVVGLAGPIDLLRINIGLDRAMNALGRRR